MVPATYKRLDDCPGFLTAQTRLADTLGWDLKAMDPYPSKQKAAELPSTLPVFAWATNVVFQVDSERGL